jgi:hypothetical protein
MIKNTGQARLLLRYKRLAEKRWRKDDKIKKKIGRFCGAEEQKNHVMGMILDFT